LLPLGESWAMAAVDSDIEWLSDYILHFLESSTWIYPVAQFVDERCIIFDVGHQEEKLEYTECHIAYQKLVDGLFAEWLKELSVSDADFERFCCFGLTTNSQLHRVLVEQLLSVEDYMTFKGMMVQRNADLYRETLRSMAEDQVQYAVEDACDEVDTIDTTVFDLLEEDGREAGHVVAQEWRQCEDQILTELASSGEEELEAQRRCEEAELERAIALSLQAEEERVRRLTEVEATSEEVQDSASLSPVDAGMAAQPAAEPPLASGACMAPAAGGGAKRELAPLKKVLPRMLRVEPLSQAVPSFLNAPSPDIEHLRVDVLMQRERAGRVMASPHPPPPPATIADPPAPAHSHGQRPTEAERRLRSERLHQHRQLLLERRRQDRERHFTAARTQLPGRRDVGGLDRAASAARLTPEPDEASRRLASELGAAPLPPDTMVNAPPATAQQLRHALTAQLRQTLPGAVTNSGLGPVGDQIDRLEQLRLR